MADPTPSNAPPKPPTAGGFILAVGVIGGTAIGVSQGQATIGFLAGLGVSAAIAVAMWWRSRG